MNQIRKVRNGYIVTDEDRNEYIALTLQDVFNRLLLSFEGKAPTFKGDSFGLVIILLDNRNTVHDETVSTHESRA